MLLHLAISGAAKISQMMDMNMKTIEFEVTVIDSKVYGTSQAKMHQYCFAGTVKCPVKKWEEEYSNCLTIQSKFLPIITRKT